MKRLANHSLRARPAPALILIALAVATGGCAQSQAGEDGGTRAWIDVPRDGSVISQSAHPVMVHASDAAGIRQVELIVNGTRAGGLACENAEQPLVVCRGEWLPPAPGEYQLVARAVNPSGSVGTSAHVNVSVEDRGLVQAQPTQQAAAPTAGVGVAVPTATLAGVTRAPSTSTVAAPATTGATAASSTSTTAARQPTAGLGTPSPMPTATWTRAPAPASLTPSRTATRVPTVAPSNTTPPTATRTATRTPSRTPSPTPDTQGPAAPGIVGPKNNRVFTPCPPKPTVILDWTAPADPSGIANYRVRLQVKVGTTYQDKQIWDPVTATQVDATSYVDCGGIYQWRIFARDRAGNQGQVSEWAQFSMDLP